MNRPTDRGILIIFLPLFLLIFFLVFADSAIAAGTGFNYFSGPDFGLRICIGNTSSDISKLTKISRAAAAAGDITSWYLSQIPRRNRAVSCLYYKAKKFRTLRNWRNFHM